MTKVNDLLDQAAKPEPRDPQPFTCADRKPVGLARAWIAAALIVESKQKILKDKREGIIDFLAPWHHQACQDAGRHEPSVLVETKLGVLRATFAHRYEKIKMSQLEAVQDAAGDHFEEWFIDKPALEVKKEVAEDPAKFNALIKRLAEVLGEEEFLANFQAPRQLGVLGTFTKEKFTLSSEQLRSLEAAGVHQIVNIARV